MAVIVAGEGAANEGSAAGVTVMKVVRNAGMRQQNAPNKRCSDVKNRLIQTNKKQPLLRNTSIHR